ncbi:MAG: hypothetical protein AB1798_21905, partial [Spirochaetota bacterium]
MINALKKRKSVFIILSLILFLFIIILMLFAFIILNKRQSSGSYSAVLETVDRLIRAADYDTAKESLETAAALAGSRAGWLGVLKRGFTLAQLRNDYTFCKKLTDKAATELP